MLHSPITRSTLLPSHRSSYHAAFKLAREVARRDPLLAGASLWTLGAAILFSLLMIVDHRLLLGVNVWVKPAKFGISFSVYFATLAWLMAYLGHTPWQRKAIARANVVGLILEAPALVIQAARGVRSHHNTETLFDSALFGIMGIGVLIQTLAIVWLIGLFFDRRVKLPAAYLWGVRLGLMIFFVGLLPGGVMLQLASHNVGVADGGRGLPFLNWSVDGGDLRVAHFVGMHALQVLPLVGWLLTKRLGSGRRGAQWIGLCGLVYLTAVVGVFAQALASSPFIAAG